MTLLGLILVIAFFGVVLWLVNTYLPMPPPVKTILNVVAVVALLLWLLQVTGIFSGNFRVR
jgi:hypothetical protein